MLTDHSGESLPLNRAHWMTAGLQITRILCCGVCDNGPIGYEVQKEENTETTQGLKSTDSFEAGAFYLIDSSRFR